MIWVILYLLMVGVSAFFLYFGAITICEHDPEWEVPWPLIAAVVWPIGDLLGAAYIAARWYAKHTDQF